jgi:hypothetical protein
LAIGYVFWLAYRIIKLVLLEDEFGLRDKESIENESIDRE